MKNPITFLMCVLCILTGIAQNDSSGNQMQIPEKTPELKALYQQARQLENSGTAAEINANRIAIKNAWQAINPAIAALYKPVEFGNGKGFNIVERGINPEDAQPISRSTEDWSTDLLLDDKYRRARHGCYQRRRYLYYHL